MIPSGEPQTDNWKLETGFKGTDRTDTISIHSESSKADLRTRVEQFGKQSFYVLELD